MAALTRGGLAVVVAVAVGLLAGWLASCGKLVGLSAPVTPLAQIQVEVTGDLGPLVPPEAAGDTPHLQVALIWGALWLPEHFCILPPESDAAAAVIAAGCPDSFRFVPSRVAANVAVAPGVPTTLDLVSLPAADVMIGDVTARVAYGSLVVYDDRNGTGTLELEHHTFHDVDGGTDTGDDAGPPRDHDIVYGASFVSMTLPDQRVAFREGAFNGNVAFYPRAGCPDPPAGFSVLAAGGFSAADAVVAALQGQLPQEDPATCATATLAAQVVTIPLQAPDAVQQVVCEVNGSGGTTRYREPPLDSPDLVNRAWACVGLPHFGEDDGGTGVVQLVVASRPEETCKRVTHFILSGCDNDPTCATPTWPSSPSPPPTWWPCPLSQ
jgi:hypothetical protein